jgi:hypothetical protein
LKKINFAVLGELKEAKANFKRQKPQRLGG